jgi:hypothetical protein
MSFIIRGGYDIFLKQVLNVSLKHSNKWSQGMVMVRPNKFVSTLTPLNENKLEMVKYNENHALLLNNAIIYEDKNLFSYKIELQGFREIDVYEPNIYDFLECHYVECYAMKHVGRWREVN